MKVLVCGGRTFHDVDWLFSEMNNLHYTYKFTVLIHGAAKGADTYASRWATIAGLKEEAYPADWKTYGKKAGFLRNTQMLEEGKPDLVVAFPGGVGTRMMLQLAEKAGVSFMEFSRE